MELIHTTTTRGTPRVRAKLAGDPAPMAPRSQQSAALRGILLLADGSCFRGEGLGHPEVVSGELVFTTSMTGYQETLTDPSYRGQLVMFTYPLIGNYGVAPGRAQSECVHPRAAILATLSDGWSGPEPRGYPPNMGLLRDYLLFNRVPTLHGVDTRAIAHRIRMHGAMPAVLSIHGPGCEPAIHDLQTALHDCSYDATDFIAEATVTEPALYGQGRRLVALIDCGNKRHVIDELVRRDTQVAVLPSHTSANDILSLAPDGVVISNGPGNPALATGIVDTIRQLYGRIPLFGICLGHQLLALAASGHTYKLKFGHRGANHPVQDCNSGRAFITTQNHGYAVDPASLPDDLSVSHRNLNDGTVEGLRHRTLPIQSLQFHPEGAPGPRDAAIVLDEWLERVVSCES